MFYLNILYTNSIIVGADKPSSFSMYNAPSDNIFLIDYTIINVPHRIEFPLSSTPIEYLCLTVSIWGNTTYLRIFLQTKVLYFQSLTFYIVSYRFILV